MRRTQQMCRKWQYLKYLVLRNAIQVLLSARTVSALLFSVPLLPTGFWIFKALFSSTHFLRFQVCSSLFE